MIRVQLLISIVKFDRFEWAWRRPRSWERTDIVPLAASASKKRLIAAAGSVRSAGPRSLVEAAQQAQASAPTNAGVWWRRR